LKLIEIEELTKRYGRKLAVDRLTFEVRPGRVTGFLGPNGAGKSTTMRVALGLDSPSGGRATINGMPYRSLGTPLRTVGSLLDGRAMHGGRSAYNHLMWMSQSNGIPTQRVDAVLEMVGLTSVAAKRTKGFSLGMGQRLGIAAALLGDPEVLLLDEPVNGLDTEGIRWIRDLMKRLAAEGRTILLSSHLMSEMELTADHLIVIGQGRLIADTSMREFIEHNSQSLTIVRSPEIDRLREALERSGGSVRPHPEGGWAVSGHGAATIGDIASAQGITLHELTPRFSSLEEVYTQMTKTSVEYRGTESAPEREPVSTGRKA
jgi:ABC-2 type transport system ATP-binding protein